MTVVAGADIDNRGVRGLRWAPGGEHVVYDVSTRGPQRDSTAIWIADVEGVSRLLVPQGDNVGWSPDGKWLAYQANPVVADPTSFSPPVRADGPSPGHDGQPLWVIEVATGATRYIAGDASVGRRAIPSVWSPDSRFIAYWRNAIEDRATHDTNGEMFATDIATGQQIDVGEHAESQRPEWSPSSRRTIFANREIDLVTDTAHELFSPPLAFVAWSGDGAKVAYVTGALAAHRELVVQDLASSSKTVVAQSDVGLAYYDSPGFDATFSPDGTSLTFAAISSTQQGPSIQGSPSTPEPDLVHAKLTLVNLSTGGNRVLFDPIYYGDGLASFSPNGEWLLVESRGDPIQLCALNVNSGRIDRFTGSFIMSSDRPASWRPSP